MKRSKFKVSWLAVFCVATSCFALVAFGAAFYRTHAPYLAWVCVIYAVMLGFVVGGEFMRYLWEPLVDDYAEICKEQQRTLGLMLAEAKRLSKCQ